MTVRKQSRRDPKTGAQSETWIVDFTFDHADGRVERVRKVSPVQNKRGAEEYERQLRAEMLSGRPQRKEVPRFDRFVEDRWLPTYPLAAGNRASTIRVRKDHCRLYLTPALGAKRLDEIKGEIIDRLFADLKSHHDLSPKTIAGVRGTLRRILMSAVEWEILAALPRLPKVKVPEVGFDFFTKEESDKILAAARTPAERLLLMFAIQTGARAGEQIGFQWGDIDWHRGIVIFRRTISAGVVGPTKTGKDRKVPLTAELKAALKAHKHLRGDLVFCRDDGSPLSIWQLHERLDMACRRAQLRRITWHSLRHSFASQLMIAGVPIRVVQEWMGHSTITMTMRYSHLAPNTGADLIAVLESNGNQTATGIRAIAN